MPQINITNMIVIDENTPLTGVKHTVDSNADAEQFFVMAAFRQNIPADFKVEFGIEMPDGTQSPRTHLSFKPGDLQFEPVDLIQFISTNRNIAIQRDWSLYWKPVPAVLPAGARIDIQWQSQMVYSNV